MAVLMAESGGNPTAQSPAKAEGLMQLTKIAVEEVQQQYDITGDVNIFNPEENIRYGVLLLEFYYRQAGSIKATLVLYNSGYAGLNRYRQGGLSATPAETQAYVTKIMGSYRSYTPMFSRELPERDRDSYLRNAIDNVFDQLYGIGADGEGVVLGRGVFPRGVGERTLTVRN